MGWSDDDHDEDIIELGLLSSTLFIRETFSNFPLSLERER